MDNKISAKLDEELEKWCADAQGISVPELRRRWRQGCEAEDRRKAQYDGEAGLANLEAILGLTSSGDESQRVDGIVAAVERSITKWASMLPTALTREHGAIDALFRVIARADMYAYLNNGREFAELDPPQYTLPNCWWGHLVIRLDKRGLYESLWDQIHRETQAQLAQATMKEERSAIGKNAASAGHAKHRDNMQTARDWYAAHKTMTKDAAAEKMVKDGIVHASFRTVRGYLTGQ